MNSGQGRFLETDDTLTPEAIENLILEKSLQNLNIILIKNRDYTAVEHAELEVLKWVPQNSETSIYEI